MKKKEKKKKLREKKLFEHLSCNGSNDKNRTATQTLSIEQTQLSHACFKPIKTTLPPINLKHM